MNLFSLLTTNVNNISFWTGIGCEIRDAKYVCAKTWGSGCSSVGRAVASDTRGPRCSNTVIGKNYIEHLLLSVLKIKKQRPGMAHLKKTWSILAERCSKESTPWLLKCRTEQHRANTKKLYLLGLCSLLDVSIAKFPNLLASTNVVIVQRCFRSLPLEDTIC